MSMLAKAIAFAADKHVNQVDKGGNAYILHPLRMMMRLRTDDEELMCVAVLHDVIEDCGIGQYELQHIGMSVRVIKSIFLLTRGHDQSYEEFIDSVCESADAMLVKREDLRDNSDITRLKGLRDKDFERMQKYMKAFHKIDGKLKELGL